VKRGAERFGCVCLLKGADTLIAEPGTGVWVCSLGTPALATAGSGDVLTGVTAALLAKGLEARVAAAAAAVACQLASRQVSQRGAIASDVIATLPAVPY
jgi:NAD(P)H-hydrate repair Nnr-like enzyme with NAD(P)H-hydrate dehydratase domain